MPDEPRTEKDIEIREKWNKRRLMDREMQRHMERRTRQHMKWLTENRLLPGRQLAELEDDLNRHWAGKGEEWQP